MIELVGDQEGQLTLAESIHLIGRLKEVAADDAILESALTKVTGSSVRWAQNHKDDLADFAQQLAIWERFGE